MFEFTTPETLDDALALWNDQSRWLAGGTDLVPEMKLGLATFGRLVNLKRVAEMRGIHETDDGLRIGALTTLTEIAESTVVRQRYRALAEACDLSASPQLRNVATIGGNLNQDSRCAFYRGAFHCWLKGGAECYMREGENREAAIIGFEDCVHVHPSDPANALVAFDAMISIRGKNGTRKVAAKDFFRAPTNADKRLNVLQPGEIIVSLSIPSLSISRSSYLKAMDRATWTFALASVAVRLDLHDNTIMGARVVMGGVAPLPWRESRAEDILNGAQVSEEIATRAAEQCLCDAKPLEHNGYKIQLARALAKRAILQAS